MSSVSRCGPGYGSLENGAATESVLHQSAGSHPPVQKTVTIQTTVFTSDCPTTVTQNSSSTTVISVGTTQSVITSVVSSPSDGASTVPKGKPSSLASAPSAPGYRPSGNTAAVESPSKPIASSPVQSSSSSAPGHSPVYGVPTQVLLQKRLP